MRSGVAARDIALLELCTLVSSTMHYQGRHVDAREKRLRLQVDPIEFFGLLQRSAVKEHAGEASECLRVAAAREELECAMKRRDRLAGLLHILAVRSSKPTPRDTILLAVKTRPLPRLSNAIGVLNRYTPASS